ncbi:MAG: N-6 DNA methylase [Cellulomonadaceae bacterium]|jgi:tRNA1(Val) A37 N6-methylase TrmN6|nr:N-6 DNA methylase [Cellulomonadaceae bacterium]
MVARETLETPGRHRVATAEKRYGQHYTPRELAEFLARQTWAAMAHRPPSITVIDPACGDGELLIAFANVASREGYTGTVNLVGYEIDPQAADAARTRLAALKAKTTIRRADFLIAQRALSTGCAQVIITNPPYVRTQHLGQETSQLLAQEFSLTGRVDLTHPFVAVASRLLDGNGVLGLLCSNRFLTTMSGENIRRTLTTGELEVREIYDLGDTKLFKAAVLPAIIVASKGEKPAFPARFVSTYQSSKPPCGPPLFDALLSKSDQDATINGRHYEVKVGTFTPPFLTTTPWRLSSPESDRWLDTIAEHTWKTFGDIAKIRVGIKTTADKVFLHHDWENKAPQVESDLLRPLIVQKNIAPWKTADNLHMRVLYPYNLDSETRQTLDLNDWPGARDYFHSHEDALRQRRYVTDGGREWFEIWVPQKPALWAVPKIVFPDISERPRFALDSSGAVVNGNCYWISLKDIGDEDLAYLMLGVANSSLGLRYYDEVCGNRLYSGKRRWITQYVKRLPLPYPETANAQRIIGLSRELVHAGTSAREHQTQLDSLVNAAFSAART